MTDETLVDDLTPEILAKLNAYNNTSDVYRVYFKSDTKEILAITNEESSASDTFFETQFDQVEEFLTGKSNFNLYVVFLNKDQKFEIIPKVIDQTAFKSSALVTIPKLTDNASLTITNNTFLKVWILELAEEDKLRLANNVINYKFKIFIADSANKNFLYRVLTIDLNDLVTYNKLMINHKHDIENLPNKILLSTTPFLKSYGLRTTYESEI